MNSKYIDEFVHLSDIAEINPPRKSVLDIEDDTEVSFISMSDTTESGRWLNKQTRHYREVRQGYTCFAEGDVLFAKITPCTENGKGCLTVGLKNGVGYGSTEFHVLRANKDGDNGFIFQWSIAKPLRQKAAASMTGSAGQQRVPSSFFSQYKIPRIPKIEQTQIAAILSTIDRAIEQTEAIIAKQQRIKTGLMQDLLTKGIDEDGNVRSEETHEFKDSPLGRIPVEWEVVPLLKFSLNSQNSFVNGPFGSDLLTSELQEQGVPVIYVRDILPGIYQRVSTVHVTSAKANQLQACNVYYGDILIAKVGDPPCDAAIYTSEERGVVTQDVIRIRLSSRGNSSFLCHLINSNIGRNAIKGITIQGTRARVSLTEFKTLLLPQPKQKEQVEISQFLESVQLTIQKEQNQLDKLKLLKTGLMQDLLTGKVRVTELLKDTAEASP